MPEVKEVVGGYIYEWNDGIEIKVSRIDHHKDGKITGELQIINNLNGTPKIILPSSQYNFSSSRTRDSLIKTMDTDFQGYDWKTIINSLCHDILERSRKGEEAKELWTHEDIQKPQFLLEPIIYKGLPTLIFGDKGVNKSRLALVFYICMILPWNDNPLGLKVGTKSPYPLILDWEVESEIVQWNAKMLQEGMGLPTFPVYHRRCVLPLADDVEQIQRIMSELGSQVIILDSLGQAAGGDLKDAQVALKFHTALRQLKTTSLIIGQTSKDAENKKSAYGSTFFQYYARNIYELRKQRETSDNEVCVGLFNTYRNLGKLEPPMAFKFIFNDDISCEVFRVDARAVPEFLERMSNSTKILAQLKEKPMNRNMLTEILEIPRNTVDVTVRRLIKSAKIIELEGGKLGLVTHQYDMSYDNG